jgi:hypothetical protein
MKLESQPIYEVLKWASKQASLQAAGVRTASDFPGHASKQMDMAIRAMVLMGVAGYAADDKNVFKAMKRYPAQKMLLLLKKKLEGQAAGIDPKFFALTDTGLFLKIYKMTANLVYSKGYDNLMEPMDVIQDMMGLGAQQGAQGIKSRKNRVRRNTYIHLGAKKREEILSGNFKPKAIMYMMKRPIATHLQIQRQSLQKWDSVDRGGLFLVERGDEIAEMDGVRYTISDMQNHPDPKVRMRFKELEKAYLDTKSTYDPFLDAEGDRMVGNKSIRDLAMGDSEDRNTYKKLRDQWMAARGLNPSLSNPYADSAAPASAEGDQHQIHRYESDLTDAFYKTYREDFLVHTLNVMLDQGDPLGKRIYQRMRAVASQLPEAKKYRAEKVNLSGWFSPNVVFAMYLRNAVESGELTKTKKSDFLSDPLFLMIADHWKKVDYDYWSEFWGALEMQRLDKGEENVLSSVYSAFSAQLRKALAEIKNLLAADDQFQDILESLMTRKSMSRMASSYPARPTVMVYISGDLLNITNMPKAKQDEYVNQSQIVYRFIDPVLASWAKFDSLFFEEFSDLKTIKSDRWKPVPEKYHALLNKAAASSRPIPARLASSKRTQRAASAHLGRAKTAGMEVIMEGDYFRALQSDRYNNRLEILELPVNKQKTVRKASVDIGMMRREIRTALVSNIWMAANVKSSDSFETVLKKIQSRGFSNLKKDLKSAGGQRLLDHYDFAFKVHMTTIKSVQVEPRGYSPIQFEGKDFVGTAEWDRCRFQSVVQDEWMQHNESMTEFFTVKTAASARKVYKLLLKNRSQIESMDLKEFEAFLKKKRVAFTWVPTQWR